MLVACCLPVIAGCVMIWKSQWGYQPTTPVAGYALTGFFGPVVSLIITIGASNVAGATKKTVMAATVFVAYSVGNIIGPQLVNSGSKAQHYPELWKGLIIWWVCILDAKLCLKSDNLIAIVLLLPLPPCSMWCCGGKTELGTC